MNDRIFAIKFSSFAADPADHLHDSYFVSHLSGFGMILRTTKNLKHVTVFNETEARKMCAELRGLKKEFVNRIKFIYVEDVSEFRGIIQGSKFGF